MRQNKNPLIKFQVVLSIYKRRRFDGSPKGEILQGGCLMTLGALETPVFEIVGNPHRTIQMRRPLLRLRHIPDNHGVVFSTSRTNAGSITPPA